MQLAGHSPLVSRFRSNGVSQPNVTVSALHHRCMMLSCESSDSPVIRHVLIVPQWLEWTDVVWLTYIWGVYRCTLLSWHMDCEAAGVAVSIQKTIQSSLETARSAGGWSRKAFSFGMKQLAIYSIKYLRCHPSCLYDLILVTVYTVMLIIYFLLHPTWMALYSLQCADVPLRLTHSPSALSSPSRYFFMVHVFCFVWCVPVWDPQHRLVVWLHWFTAAVTRVGAVSHFGYLQTCTRAVLVNGVYAAFINPYIAPELIMYQSVMLV